MVDTTRMSKKVSTVSSSSVSSGVYDTVDTLDSAYIYVSIYKYIIYIYLQVCQALKIQVCHSSVSNPI